MAISEPVKYKTLSEIKETVIGKDIDLYSPDLMLYIFHYNDKEAVAAYQFDNETAYKISCEADQTGEYWGGTLGPGGSIYDEPDEFLKKCLYGHWIDTANYPDYYKKGRNRINNPPLTITS